MARVSSLEEAANKDLYDKYFPKAQSTSDQPHQGPSTLPSSQHCCSLPLNCCSHTVQGCQYHRPVLPHDQHQHLCHRCPPHSSSPPDNVVQHVLKLEVMIREVEALQRNAGSNNKPTEGTQNLFTSQTMTMEPANEIILDESITSVENDIPENPLETSHLNS